MKEISLKRRAIIFITITDGVSIQVHNGIGANLARTSSCKISVQNIDAATFQLAPFCDLVALQSLYVRGKHNRPSNRLHSGFFGRGSRAVAGAGAAAWGGGGGRSNIRAACVRRSFGFVGVGFIAAGLGCFGLRGGWFRFRVRGLFRLFWGRSGLLRLLFWLGSGLVGSGLRVAGRLFRLVRRFREGSRIVGNFFRRIDCIAVYGFRVAGGFCAFCFICAAF